MFDGLEAGTYTVYAASSYSAERAVCTNVVVRANETTVAESLKLTATGSISGKITLDGKTTGNTGFLVFVAGTSYMAMTDDSGAYCISGVPAAEGWQVVASKNNVIHYISTSVTVEANGNTELKDHNFTSSEVNMTVQGEKGEPGDAGKDGNDGKDGTNGISITWLGTFDSADEIASPEYLNAYFNMTDGCSYIYDGTNWTLLAKAGTNGKDGADGKDGDKGDDGTNGLSIVWKGELDAAPNAPEKNWAYFNKNDGCSYIWNGSKWDRLSEKGAQGDKGADGTNGKDGTNGTNGTNGADGLSIVWKGELESAPSEPATNWAYFNRNDGCSYIWNGTKRDKLSEKGAQGDKGADGTNGKDGTIGTNGTNGTNGADGLSIVWKGELDTAPSEPATNWAYFNKNDGCSYIWSGTKWDKLSEKGAQGDKGADGTNGTNGKDGDKGDDGTNGAGITWLGSFASESEIPNPVYLNAFYNTTDRCSYIYDGTKWTSLTRSDYKFSNSVSVNDIVSFGSWPQTIKAEDVTITDETKTAGMFTYYKGSDGEWYVKAAEKAYGSDYKYSDGTTVGKGGTSEKYFKVEPIKWRVLTDNYSGKKLLLAESILVNCKYYDNSDNRTINENTIYLNNYEHSRIRAYLNGMSYNKAGSSNEEFYETGFLQTAFTAGEIEQIATVTVDNSARSTNPDANATQWNSGENQYACNNTEDKIFLLSEQEVTTTAYGFDVYNASGVGNARIRLTTDYAKASGSCQITTVGYGGYWWLRSPCYDYSNGARYIGFGGYSDDHYYIYVINDYIGVVPALCLK